MLGLDFEMQPAVAVSQPNRADIACFVGLVARRRTPLPADLQRWLDEQAWVAGPYGKGAEAAFQISQLKRPAAFAQRLKAAAGQAQESVAKYVHQHLPTAQQQAIPDDPTKPVPARLLTALVNVLNELRFDATLYSEARFAGGTLTPEIQHLLKSKPHGAKLVRLNRLLLEQAFAEEIATLSDVLDVPVPIETWEVFDYLFDWETRPLDGKGQVCTSYLGAAVRSYFAQGGRKCYVVRTGEPINYNSRQDQRHNQLSTILPGWPQMSTVQATDRYSWHGIGHLFGLPDVSFLCLPDLPDLIGTDRDQEVMKEHDPPPVVVQFLECSEGEQKPGADLLAPAFTAPRCNDKEYEGWATALRHVTEVIAGRASQLREIQFVAAVPIPAIGHDAAVNSPARDLWAYFNRPSILTSQWNQTGIASAFLQLAYPWVRSDGSGNLPERLESPDGVLAGVLARNALMRGAYHSAAGLHLADVYEVAPTPTQKDLRNSQGEARRLTARNYSMLERISLLGPTPGGFRVLSDVTTSLDESYRPACINRLISVLVRAARRLGEELTFEAANEQLWERFRQSLYGLLLNLFHEGALRGETPEQAFQIRCDRSTMTQNDLDNGRVIAVVQFEAARPIEHITVVLALNEGGQVALLPSLKTRREAA